MNLSFIVPAIPVAQPRARAVSVGGRARVFGAPKSHAVHSFKATVRMAAQAAYSGPPIARGVGVDLRLVFVLPRPGGLPKRLGTGRLRHVKKPDFDNLEKSGTDALTGLLYEDDSQLCRVQTEKWIAAVGEQPHVEVQVSEAPTLDTGKK